MKSMRHIAERKLEVGEKARRCSVEEEIELACGVQIRTQ